MDVNHKIGTTELLPNMFLMSLMSPMTQTSYETITEFLHV